MMNKVIIGLLAFILLIACQENATNSEEVGETVENQETTGDFVWNPENFSDKKIIRYQIPGFDQLSLDQKKLVYYLTQAGLSGRDISYDQNYRHNLTIRRAIDHIVKNYKGDKNSDSWNSFMTYAKNVWFSSGIHHHYSNDKFIPEFSQEYFGLLLQETGTKLSDEVLQVMFDSSIDPKKVNQDPNNLVQGSAVNFYDPTITEADVDKFYSEKKEALNNDRISLGLNSKLVKNSDGSIEERVWKVGGLYGPAIEEIIKWLEKAVTVAENEAQGNALKLLIEYYKTGDLETWDKYNIAWVQATEGDIDYINSFIEVYNDPKGYKGSYETIVEINDFEASAQMKVISDNSQWFEDNSPIMDAHKKKEVKGIAYKVVTVAGEAGDASPSTPIGVNLPNANWIRAKYGSKSVSLGNIIDAYSKVDGPNLTQEFAHDEEEAELSKKHGRLASKMQTALHEVLGHASGQLEEGVGTPKETLKNYASPLEEARADLVALYYVMDPKMIELGLIESADVGKAAYDSYIRNGLMLQLRRIIPGNNIEQAHMRNRQMVASWVFEKGQENNAVSKVVRDGKTYFEINDYGKMRELFGQLLKEVQRVKSQGDYEAGKNLIENYGVKVNKEIHEEVLARSEKLHIPPYGGFINPKLVPVMGADGTIADIKVEYPADFTAQMLEYGEQFSFLPDYN